jgi:hypothetical protein
MIAAGTFGKWLPTVPAKLRDDSHDLIDLIDRQQRTIGATVAPLAATLPSRGQRLLPMRRLWWVCRGRTGGIRRVLP